MQMKTLPSRAGNGIVHVRTREREHDRGKGENPERLQRARYPRPRLRRLEKERDVRVGQIVGGHPPLQTSRRTMRSATSDDDPDGQPSR